MSFSPENVRRTDCDGGYILSWFDEETETYQLMMVATQDPTVEVTYDELNNQWSLSTNESDSTGPVK